MEVVLESWTTNPEITCAKGMLSCRSEKASGEIEMDLETARVKMKNARSMGHYGCFEPAVFVFSVKGVSRSLTHQLVRHRMASYLQQSQRTVEIGAPSYVTPPVIFENKEALAEYDALMQEIWMKYGELQRKHKIPKQDARFVLPNACTTNIQITMNARALLHFFKLRLDSHAQWEIRDMANRMYKLVMMVAPSIFEVVPDDI